MASLTLIESFDGIYPRNPLRRAGNLIDDHGVPYHGAVQRKRTVLLVANGNAVRAAHWQIRDLGPTLPHHNWTNLAACGGSRWHYLGDDGRYHDATDGVVASQVASGRKPLGEMSPLNEAELERLTTQISCAGGETVTIVHGTKGNGEPNHLLWAWQPGPLLSDSEIKLADEYYRRVVGIDFRPVLDELTLPAQELADSFGGWQTFASTLFDPPLVPDLIRTGLVFGYPLASTASFLI
jgi:hypothetical protein